MTYRSTARPGDEDSLKSRGCFVRQLALARFALGAAVFSVLTVNAVSDTNSVSQWGQFEQAIINTNTYADPYRGVTLNVTYTRPDTNSVNFWGFYDGGNTWRIRFMPDQVGTWSYSASFSDGAPGANGSFQCVTGNIPGMISADATNALWFGFKGGGHGLFRSLQLGDRFFASNWPTTNRTAFLDWAQGQGYNTLSIASHYLNRNFAGRGQGWNTPNLWDPASPNLKAAEYQAMETILNDLAARQMMVFPFAGFFGQSSDFPTNQTDQALYIRYTLARVAPYWNVLMQVAGPEPLVYPALFQNSMALSDINRLGNLIQSYNVSGHLLSNHNGQNTDAFANQPWETFTTLQGPDNVNRQTLGAALLAHRGVKPLLAAEVLWPGNQYQAAFSDSDIRKNGFVIMMSGATLNFGDMNGGSSSGFSGTMNLADKIQSRHDIIKLVWDFFATQQFYLMSPRQDLVNNGWCLANPGSEYLVYLQQTGSVSVAVSNGPFEVEWINAQNTSDIRFAGATTNGLNLISPPDGDDWLVHLVSTVSDTPLKVSAIPNQLTTVNTSTPRIPFVVNDEAPDLVMTATSSNPALVTTNYIVFEGSGTNRTITLTPLPNQLGNSTITTVVSDNGSPSLSASNTFILSVVSRPIIQSISLASGNKTLTWSAIAGKSYRVQYTLDLNLTNWSDLAGDVTAVGTNAMKVDTTVSNATTCFYRIEVLP